VTPPPSKRRRAPAVEPVLRGVGLAKAYGEGDARVVALADFSVDVCPGLVTAVVGPSGSGKTTLLHCLSGIAVPDAGEVLLDGQDLTRLDDAARAAVRRQSMGFVFQRGNLVPALTVAENVSAGLVLQGRSRDEVREGVARVLDRVGLADRAQSYPAQLSGGQLQRAALARALATAPRVLWADEPTGALDRAAAGEMAELLRQAAEQGTAVVVASHDSGLADAADVVVRVRDGRREE
jgi:putative ABC transport system ATP-binding protein